MTHPLRTERPEPPKHSKISKLLKHHFNLAGRRSQLATEARIRRKAQRLGLYASRTRLPIGGWLIDCNRYGTLIAGPGLNDDQAEALLSSLIAEKRAKPTNEKPADTGMSAGLEMPSTTKSKAR